MYCRSERGGGQRHCTQGTSHAWAATHLNRLPVLTEDVDPNDGTLPLGVCTLNNIIIQVFLPSKLVETLEDELEQSLQVLGTRTRHEHIRVTVQHGQGDRQSQCGGLSSSTGGGEGDGLRKGFGSDGVGEGEDRLGLIECPSFSNNLSNTLGILETLLERTKFRLSFCFTSFTLTGRTTDSDSSIGVERDDVLAGRDGENIQFVIDDETGWVGTEGKEETFVETSDGGGVGGVGAVARVDVLRACVRESAADRKRCREHRNAPWSSSKDHEDSSSLATSKRRFLLPRPFRSSWQASWE